MKTQRHAKSIGVIAITVLNALFSLFGALCLVNTSENNRLLNAVDTEFVFEETSEGVVLRLSTGKQARLFFHEDSVTVMDAYRYNGKAEILELVVFVQTYTKAHGLPLTRTTTELIGEYRLHDILYRLNYAREQTCDLDWDYTQDRRWYVNTASCVLGWCGI